LLLRVLLLRVLLLRVLLLRVRVLLRVAVRLAQTRICNHDSRSVAHG
jgi:hypothetical protein